MINCEYIENDIKHITEYSGDLLIDTQNDSTPKLRSFYIES